MKRQIIPHNGSPSPLQPIVYAALVANGANPGDLARNRLWHEIPQNDPAPGVPSVSCRADGARVRWDDGDTCVVLYVNGSYDRPDVWEHKIEIRSFGLPDTVVNACVGMTLDRIVAMPGAEGIRILAAETTAGGHVLDIEHVIVGAMVPDGKERP